MADKVDPFELQEMFIDALIEGVQANSDTRRRQGVNVFRVDGDMGPKKWEIIPVCECCGFERRAECDGDATVPAGSGFKQCPGRAQYETENPRLLAPDGSFLPLKSGLKYREMKK